MLTRTLGSLALASFVTAGAAADAPSATLVGTWDGFTTGSYADVWGDGDHAYLGHFGSAEIDIVDISDPTAPILAAAYALPPPNESGSAQDVKVAEGLLFIAVDGGGNSVHIVDVRDPADPVGLVDIAIDGFTHIHNVFYHEGYLYLADSDTTRVGIVDLTTFDPDDPPASNITETKWMIEGVGTSRVHDVTVVGDRLYACAWDSGLWIYDITNVENQEPTFLGSGPGDNTHSCWPTADGQYVIAGEERPAGGILVYRITENAGATVTLEITDQASVPPEEASSVHNQVTIGHRVYNSWYGAGMRVYDVDPVTGLLTLVVTYDTPDIGAAWGIDPQLGPERVLMSDISDGLFILDVTGAFPCPEDLDASGDVAFGDVLAVIAAWGPCVGLCREDLDGSGDVAFGDILAVIAAWGPCR
ncbi:MAG: LVIVD repeat-containing protein [Planctomycetota bacterium]|jgi:hypothetical protein